MPLKVAGKQVSNGALAVGAGLIVGLVDTFLPWHSTTVPTTFGSDSGGHDALGYWSGWLFFLVVLIGIVLFVLRTFVPQVNMPALPVTDSMIYLGIGAVMLLTAFLWLITGGGYANLYAAYSALPGYSSGPSIGVFIGIITGAAVGVGGSFMKSDPQPATRPLRSSQSPGSTAPSPPAPPAPST